MKENKNQEGCCGGKTVVKNQHFNQGSGGAIYGMGVIGALFYFLQNAVGVGPVLVGIGKAIFWPALVVFEVLTGLGV